MSEREMFGQFGQIQNTNETVESPSLISGNKSIDTAVEEFIKKLSENN